MKLRPFELGLVVFFGILAVVALILLRAYSPDPDTDTVAISGPVSIWGVLPEEAFKNLLLELSTVDKTYSQITYYHITPEDFDNRFITALADQSSPDLLLISHESLVKHRGRLAPYPYAVYPLRDFRNAYLDGAEIFALSDGIYAAPLMVDPLMLFWNRNIFATNNFLKAPATWEELVGDLVPQLTQRDQNRNVTRATVALGEYRNIKNAFPIISLLTMQSGSLLTAEAGSYNLRLNQRPNSNEQPFTNAVTFYSNFNQRSNSLYTWDQSLPLDSDQFISEDLAMYFGFASEGREIAARNPNLAFDTAEVPQSSASNLRRTYGRFYGLVMPKQAQNKAGAEALMNIFYSDTNLVRKLADSYGMVTLQRSEVAKGSNDIYGSQAYLAAPTARGWLNPDRQKVDNIFIQMVEEINSNRGGAATVASDTVLRLQAAY